MVTDLRCPAKINLGLTILGQRDDGYHDLATVFYKLPDISDRLELSDSDLLTFSCSEPVLNSKTNLVMRAAQAFFEAAGIGENNQTVSLHLTKRIPAGAGLGGGSSDAASALQLLNDHFEQPLSASELFEVGSKLGADVPFFLLRGSAAYGEGIGDRLTPLPYHIELPILVAKPKDLSVSTAAAYGAKEWPRTNPPDFRLILTEPIETWMASLTNDFEPVVFEMHPQLEKLKNEMLRSGATYAAMSGSGAAIYGIFPTSQQAELLRDKLEADGLFAAIQNPTVIRAVG